MATRNGMEVIALEEHYYDPEVIDALAPEALPRARPAVRERLDDVGQGRIKAMDDAGIDIQVLSHGAPSTQRFDPETAVRLARAANDRLAETCRAYPERFAGFAALPTPDPEAAAEELERSVTRLGFKGAMVHGLTNGAFLDEKRFWPVFERARALDVPVYLHPALPHRAVVDAYLKDYLQDFPGLIGAGWGFTIETATAGIRLVLSGVFEAYPGLKIILGHLGEGLPFSLWRIDQALSRPGNRSSSFRETFREHVWITTSGNFSDPALLCSVMEMGVDRILFSVDWPFVDNEPGVAWAETIPLSTEDRRKILHGNARRLLKL